ncbi:hypothetical protein K438DRAFT_2013954 [Mycena galopus ATCC 62051]|nr:hypothetical protein K438DRAFT_2013954 [Mycena galopus ATCC 62051]
MQILVTTTVSQKNSADPFHPHHISIDLEVFFKSDRHLRRAITKAILAESKELQIIRELSSAPLRAESSRNHTTPVLQFICGGRVEFAVHAGASTGCGLPSTVSNPDLKRRASY